jgi:hypothetical protein
MSYAFHKPQALPVDMGGSTDGLYENNSISWTINNNATASFGGDEMLKITPNGFYVRGVKVEQDNKEAEIVYNAFKQWLAWAQLTAK